MRSVHNCQISTSESVYPCRVFQLGKVCFWKTDHPSQKNNQTLLALAGRSILIGYSICLDLVQQLDKTLLHKMKFLTLSNVKGELNFNCNFRAPNRGSTIETKPCTDQVKRAMWIQIEMDADIFGPATDVW